MDGIGTALAMDWIRKGRWSFLQLLALPLCTLGMLMIFAHMGKVAPQDLHFVFFLTFMPEATICTLLLVAAQNNMASAQQAGGLPPRLYTLPVATARLVFWQMAPAIGLLALTHLYVSIFFRVLTGVLPPLLEPLLFLAAIYSVACAVIWSLPGFVWLRVLALGVMTAPLGVWFTPYSVRIEPVPDAIWAPPTAVGLLRLALYVVAGYGLAVAGVRRDRRGDAPSFPGVKSRWYRLLDRLPRRERKFGSPQAAQLWLERRLKGWLMPAGALILVAVTLLIWAFGGMEGKDGSSRNLLLAFVGLPFYFVPAASVIAGILMGLPDLNGKGSDIDLFRATRPLGDGGLSAAMHKAGALSILTSTTILIAAAALVTAGLALNGQGGLVNEVWNGWAAEFGERTPGLGSYPLGIMLAMLAGWTAISLLTVAGQAGHGKFFGSLTSGLLALIVGVSLMRFWLSKEAVQWIIDGALLALGGCGVLGGAGGIAAAWRRGLIGPAAAALGAALWLVCLGLGGWAWWAGQVHVQGPACCLILGLLALAPATPALGALAMSWNRHR